MPKTLNEICEIQKQFDLTHRGNRALFYKEITSTNLNELEHLIVCLIGELGEFSNILKKVVRGDFELSEVKDCLDEELADVFIYLIKIANQFDVNLEKEFLNKLQKNQKRFREIDDENL